ncbi:MAG: cytochrome c oxidase subunit 3 [Myxococcales bacterium]|nr:cytochrome c oxidase subunit 3 [Myxococcales bacterium]
MTNREANARLFMGLFMGSWAIGFIALFAAQWYLRLNAIQWPPIGAASPPRILTGLSTMVTILSSLLYHWGLIGIEKSNKTQLFRGLAAASVLSFIFLVMQVCAAFIAIATGLRWDQSAYAGLFWIFAGYHFAHALLGCLAGAWLSARAWDGFFSESHHLPIRLWGYYWHSVGGLWVLIYLFVFLI